MDVRLIQQEVELLQGSYLEIPLYYPSYNDSGAVIPTDITGAIISCTIRKTATTTPLLECDTSDYIEITDAVGGKFKIKLNSELTSNFTERTSGVYKGHVEVYLNGEAVRTHCLTIYYSPEFIY